MLDFIEMRIGSDGMSQIGADGCKDFQSLLISLVCQLLHDLQLFCRSQLLIQNNAGSGCQTDHGILRKIVGAHAFIARPGVEGGIGIHIDRGKGQFVQHSGNVARSVHIAHSLRGTHGKAHHLIVLQIHGAG